MGEGCGGRWAPALHRHPAPPRRRELLEILCSRRLARGERGDPQHRDDGGRVVVRHLFVVAGDRLGGVDWVFNGWGAQSWATWAKDAAIAEKVAAAAAARVVGSPMVNEGGGFHVDGRGTALVTRTVQLDPGRNPQMDEAGVEEELARTIGARTCVWLPRGLTRDYDEFGTRGHVDIVACFTPTGRVLLHWQEDETHPDHEVCQQIEQVLLAATDSAGRDLEVTRIPAPATLADDGGPVDWSYVNHLVCNGGVVACTFDDPRDDEALAVLS